MTTILRFINDMKSRRLKYCLLVLFSLLLIQVRAQETEGFVVDKIIAKVDILCYYKLVWLQNILNDLINITTFTKLRTKDLL